MENLIALLTHYKFDFASDPEFDNFAQNVSQRWQIYSFDWVHLASVEAIYQGRYKIASVDYILKFWFRRGEPICRFNREFERLICADFGIPAPSRGIYPQNRPRATAPKVQEAQALQPWQLLAESSIFTDKLKSMSVAATTILENPHNLNICDLATTLVS